jgi:hypothetical protein
MKNLITLILVFVSFDIIAQDFAPIGAKWYYTEGFAFSGDIGYLKLESIKDTLFQGHNCKLLAKTGFLECSNRSDIEIVYSQDSTVYFWDNDFNEFQKLYSFKSAKDSSWSIKIKNNNNDTDTISVVVDSVTYTMILDKAYKVLNVTYYPKYKGVDIPFYYSSKIVYSIGDFSYLFNLYPVSFMICDMNYSGGLRCYEDSQFGFYSTGIADSCDYTYKWTGIENKKGQLFEPIIFPNPTQGIVHIDCQDNVFYKASLLDNTGRLIASSKYIGTTTFDISSLPNGLYCILIQNDKGKMITNKVIKINAR